MQNNSNKASADGIVLLAKQPGLTSFASLNNVKKALNTSKVGHTGTLDSFAQGLLVVCAGRLTKLAGNITEFDKSYSAVIKFGEETDTLEFTGQLVKKAPLPTPEVLEAALANFTGELLQAPPAFSAIHVDGKRASDLARQGIEVEIPKRKITVFSAELKETELFEGRVLYARIDFSVSKGSYIRCLARDIAESCGSAGHLTGLLRTKVGNFMLENAAGYSLLNNFTIENSKKDVENYFSKKEAELPVQEKKEKKPCIPSEADLFIQKEIREKLCGFSQKTALLCGFECVSLKDEKALCDFKNGKKLLFSMFSQYINCQQQKSIAVFYNDNFCGLIETSDNKKLLYKFVIS